MHDCVYTRSEPLLQPGLLQLLAESRVYRFRMEHATEAQEQYTDSDREVRPHAHDVYHLVFYLSGNNQCCLGSDLYPVAPGTLILTSPGIPHDFQAHRRGKVLYSELTFSLQGEDEGVLRWPFSRVLSVYLGIPDASSRLLIDTGEGGGGRGALFFSRVIHALKGVSPLSRAKACGALIDLFLWIAEFCAPYEDTSSIPAALKAARSRIEREYAGRLTVDGLAREANLSRSQFLRLFRKHFQTSPIALQQRLRIEAASTLLRTTNLLGKEVAARVGFGDEYVFSRIFRRLSGQTVTAFRRPLTGSNP